MRDHVERSVIIEVRPRVLLGAALFVFWMGTKVGRAHDVMVKEATTKIQDAIFNEPKR